MRPLKSCDIILWILVTLCTITIASAQPVANFTASPVSGCAPLLVQFTDNSTGNPTSWKWDLGNGTTSTLKNPATTYFTDGIYTVKLTVTNTSGSNSITKTQYIKVYDKPVIKFTVSDSFNCVPFTTRFSDLSTDLSGTITAWEWDFDDGTSSTLQHPQHLYNQPGSYNITLKVTNNGGCFNSISKLAYIKAADSIRTLFSFSPPTRCKPPETIRFTNSTIGPGSMTYLWKFGDGTSSTQTSVSHTYATGGVYSVTLIVNNSIGCRDTLVYKDTLVIRNVQSAINSQDSVCVNNLVPFSNATIPSALSSKWTFSDGSTAFGSTTAKTWAVPGNYNVKLVSNFNTCSDSVVKKIAVMNAPVADFSVSDSSSCKPPMTVNFTDLSVGAVSWNWDFGDGNTSSLQNPAHTYNSSGRFNVTLTATNAASCKNTITKARFIRIDKPVISFETGEGGGCAPYTFSPYPNVIPFSDVTGYLWDFGNGHTSTNRFPTEVYTDSGSYTVKLFITSDGGCTDSAIVVNAVKTGKTPLVDFSIGASVICPGTPVQFTDQSLPADRWQWFFNDGSNSLAQNPVHQFADSGKYSIKLIAWNNGCKDSLTKSKIIEVLPGLARFRPVYNCANKKEVYFKDSSILPQSWFWDFGDGTTSTQQNPTHQFANYQNYFVSLTTTNDSCTNTKSITVKTLNETADFQASKNNLCKADSVLFTFINFNKSNIAKYRWDFGDGTIDSILTDSIWHTYQRPGTYSVKLTATDLYNCSETTIKNNFIHVFAPHAGFSINSAGGCQNKAVNFTDSSNRQSNEQNIARWFWDFGDGSTQTYTAPLPNPLAHVYTSTGFFYPSLKIIDSIGCRDSISFAVPISIYQPVASFFSTNYNTCINDSVILHNLSTGKRLNYLWSFGDGNTSTDSLPAKRYSTNGLYTMKLVVTDMYGCKDSLTKNNYINVKTVTADFTVSDSMGICTPFKVSFSNTSLNALSQVWDFGDGGFSSTANPVYYYTEPGTYYAKLTAKRSAGCFNTDSVKIKVTAPRATLSYVPQNICVPLQVSFHVSTRDSVSYVWDFNDGISFTSYDSFTTHTYLLPGNFIPSVILKDSNGCIIPVIGKDTIKTNSSKVNFTVDDTVLCNSGTVNFFDSSSSGSIINTYNWNFGDGSFSTQQNPVHFYNTPGQYPVKLVVSTQACSDSAIKTNYIKVFSSPKATISGNSLNYCGPSSITMQGNLLNPDSLSVAWKWDFGNGNDATLQLPPAQQYNDTGSYIIYLITSNAAGCSDTVATTIIIHPIPATYAGKDTAICSGTTAALMATGADSYTWLPNTFLNCSNCSNPVSFSQQDIVYYVKGSNIFGCEKTDSVFIDVKQPFKISGLKNIDSICAGQSIQLNAEGAENYIWSPSPGLNNTTVNNPIANPVSSTTYQVMGYDSSNCFKDSAIIFIQVNDLPTVNAGNDTMITAGSQLTISAQYSADIIHWLWQPSAGLSCSSCPNPVAAPSGSTRYSITATNASGCTITDSILIRVNCNKNSVFLPTAFSPNQDEVNDIFYPMNAPGSGSITIGNLTIYNRFGQIVFQRNLFNSNDKAKGWDGKFNGRECPAGSYIYNISFSCNNIQLVKFSGNILLIR